MNPFPPSPTLLYKADTANIVPDWIEILDRLFKIY